jgi:predicted nucleic acid-binding protein
MNGRKLLDTNILIYLSKKELELAAFAKPADELFISVITYMEALGFPFSSEKEKRIITELCNNLSVINLDNAVVDRVIEIRRKSKIKLPDAIIAATTLEKGLVLVTRNTDDFKRKGLNINISNPF